MADENNEDDSWLYGSSVPDTTSPEEGETNGQDSEHNENADHDAEQNVCIYENLNNLSY